MKKEEKEIMKRKMIAWVFYSLAIIIFIGGTIYITSLESEFVDDLPCYDRYGHKINELTCEGWEQDSSLVPLILIQTMIVGILLVMGYIKHPNRDLGF